MLTRFWNRVCMYACIHPLHVLCEMSVKVRVRVIASGIKGVMMGQGSCRLDPFAVGYMGKGYPRLPLWRAERIGHAREAAQRAVTFSSPPDQAL